MRNEILVFDGSYYCHRSYNRANEWLKVEDFDTEDDWMSAVVGKSLEITIQSVAIALEKYNAVGAIMPLDMDTSTFVNNLKAFEPTDVSTTKYRIINAVRRELMMRLPSFGIVTCGLGGVEADDFGYQISRIGQAMSKLLGLVDGDYVLRMMTKDKDWKQNITENCIWTSGENFSEVTVADMIDTYGEYYRTTYVAEQCMTRTKDGNPGIKGIGWGGASKIMAECYDTSTGLPYDHALPEWSSDKRFRILGKPEQYQQFRHNWLNIDCEWIKHLNWPELDETVWDHMYKHMVQACHVCLAAALPTLSQMHWAMLVGACGTEPKLTSAMRRFQLYVERNNLHKPK